MFFKKQPIQGNTLTRIVTKALAGSALFGRTISEVTITNWLMALYSRRQLLMYTGLMIMMTKLQHNKVY